jgi:hypothetical protein
MDADDREADDDSTRRSSTGLVLVHPSPRFDSNGFAAVSLCERAQSHVAVSATLWGRCQNGMVIELDSTRTGNANCTIASEFKRWWQPCGSGRTEKGLHGSHLSPCTTKVVRRGSAIDLARRLIGPARF